MEPTRAVSRTSSGQAHTGAGVMRGAALCAGVDAATVTLYDGTSTSGVVIGKLGAGAGLSAPVLDVPVFFSTGLYVDVTGTTPRVTVYL